MKLNPVGPNQTEVEKPDGSTVLFSYQTPVAVFVPGRGALVTQERFSATTSRHVNKAIERWGCSRTVVPHAEIEALANA